MKKLLEEFCAAFRDSVLHTNGAWRRVLRWGTILCLGLLSVGCVVLGFIAMGAGESVVRVGTMFIYSITFPIHVVTFTFLFGTADINRESQEKLAARLKAYGLE